MNILKELAGFLDTIVIAPDIIGEDHIEKLQRLRSILGLIDQLQKGR